MNLYKVITPNKTVVEAASLIAAVSAMMYICYAMMLLAQYLKR